MPSRRRGGIARDGPWVGRAAGHATGHAAGVLLPYRRQFVLAGDDFLVELGLDPDSSI